MGDKPNPPPGEVFDAVLNTAPFVSTTMLGSHLNHPVRLIGTVLVSHGHSAEVEGPDGGRLLVKLSSGVVLTPGHVYQFLGRAETPSEFSEMASLDWGTLQTDSFNKMLQLTSQYPDLFYDRKP